MAKVSFYPNGNADCCKIDLNNGKSLLVDYANMHNSEDSEDKRIDLEEQIRAELKEADKNYFDVVAITHLDDDHFSGFSDLFYLERFDKYQSDDRIRINTLWVPAALILEESVGGEAQTLRQEARHRLIEGKGIRVFSRPQQLEKWLNDHDLELSQRAHLITDAGNTVPEFTLSEDAMEVFIHSPFAKYAEDGSCVDRNSGCLAFQCHFEEQGSCTKLMITGDLTADPLCEIVEITEGHERPEKLEWDIINVPHHCSYLSLVSNKEDKGDSITTPYDPIRRLYEDYGMKRGVLVSTSNVVPNDSESTQPPHMQAANYYKSVEKLLEGEFRVTMDHPSSYSPKPMRITVDACGATISKDLFSGVSVITTQETPRAGSNE